MHLSRRLFLLRSLLLSIVGLLAPLVKSSSAQTHKYNERPAPTGLSWYPKVPDLAFSNSSDIRIARRYRVHVRVEGSSTWNEVTAYETGSKARQIQDINPALAKQPADLGYYTHLRGWTHTYVNFEVSIGMRVEVKISRVDGQSIATASVHPRRACATHRLEGKDVIVTLTNPCLIAVDINGQMDAQHTGAGYRGPAIHTISIFANPPMEKPRMDGTDPTVYRKYPNQGMPLPGAWKTLVFMPGIHYIKSPSQLRSDCCYYIPGDAIVYGTLNSGTIATKTKSEGNKIRIFGHGTLSASLVRHPGYYTSDTTIGGTTYVKDQRIPLEQRNADGNAWSRAIEIHFAKEVEVDGITIVDSPQLTIALTGGYVENRNNVVKWVKIINWRENSDGILSSSNTKIEDCFIRNQDDSLGVGNLSVTRVVQWNDANGAAFIMSLEKALQDRPDRQILIENCDVIYSRCIFAGGGQVFKLSGDPGGRVPGAQKVYGKNVVFKDITIEDPKPSKGIFFISLGDPNKPSTEAQLGSVTYEGVTFENISIATLKNHYGQNPTLQGLSATSQIKNFTFTNMKVDGKIVLNNVISGTTPQEKFFEMNTYVTGIIFRIP